MTTILAAWAAIWFVAAIFFGAMFLIDAMFTGITWVYERITR